MFQSVLYRSRQVRDIVKRDGISRAFGMIVQRLRFGPGQWRRTEVLKQYDFVLNGSPIVTVGKPESNSLLWIIPDFNIGSGGHTTIFRIIYHLESKGYKSTILIVGQGVHVSAQSAKRDIVEHFFPLRAQVLLEGDRVGATEFVVATSWHTAYYAKRISSLARKLYFVQDYEPLFCSMGSEYIFAENTYRFDFFGITAGKWLSERLAAEYGMQTLPIGFGVEHERYHRIPRREPEIRRVFFYARPPTARRAFELGLMVLNLVHKALPSTEFILAGWDTSNYEIPFPHLAAGTVRVDELPDVYAQCDVALVLSLTNLSLMPLELMACRCAVVSNRGANVEWLLNDDVAMLCDSTPEALANAVCDALVNDTKRLELIDRAERFATMQHWEEAAAEFEKGLIVARGSAAGDAGLSLAQVQRAEVLTHYDFVSNESEIETSGASTVDSLLWIIPDFNVGSGGHLNIFRVIFNLESKGYESTILIIGPGIHKSAEGARRDIVENFFPIRSKVLLEGMSIPATEFVVATSWHSVYYAKRISCLTKKLYFVQDYEPFFYSVGSEYVFAENTYKFGFLGVTVGGWLAEKLAADYGMRTLPVGFGVEHDRYHAIPRRDPEVRRVFFYARPPTARRAFELGLMVLDLVHKALPSTEFILAGWDTSSYDIPFPHLGAGTLGLDELPDVYAQCDVALVLSMTNLSLLPLELMACRCAVVSNRGANVEWLLNDEVAILCDPTPEALAHAICDALVNDTKRLELIDRAEHFAKTQHWGQVALDFESGLIAARELISSDA
jgi:hypothetical protein